MTAGSWRLKRITTHIRDPARSNPKPKRERFLKARKGVELSERKRARKRERTRRSEHPTAKRIRAHDGCLGIRRRRRTRKTATILGEPSTGFDPGVSEWGNPAAFIGGNRWMNT